jgi:hypothetical protein
MHLPPLEVWQQVFSQLSAAQRQRMESAEFYRYLAGQLELRFQHLLRSAEPIHDL